MRSDVKPRKEPQQARSRIMVEAILEAAARVLAERGYGGTNTNLIAETAGVGIGSLYQYFPNKDALIAALHRRHAVQMRGIMARALASSGGATLRGALTALVRALLEAHSVEPELHRVLQEEFPLELRKDDVFLDRDVAVRVRDLLERHRREVRQPDPELAVYIVLNTVKSLVHRAVLSPPPGRPLPRIERAIADALMGYLTLPVREGPGRGRRSPSAPVRPWGRAGKGREKIGGRSGWFRRARYGPGRRRICRRSDVPG